MPYFTYPLFTLHFSLSGNWAGNPIFIPVNTLLFLLWVSGTEQLQTLHWNSCCNSDPFGWMVWHKLCDSSQAARIYIKLFQSVRSNDQLYKEQNEEEYMKRKWCIAKNANGRRRRRESLSYKYEVPARLYNTKYDWVGSLWMNELEKCDLSFLYSIDSSLGTKRRKSLYAEEASIMSSEYVSSPWEQPFTVPPSFLSGRFPASSSSTVKRCFIFLFFSRVLNFQLS